MNKIVRKKFFFTV